MYIYIGGRIRETKSKGKKEKKKCRKKEKIINKESWKELKEKNTEKEKKIIKRT